MEKYLYDSRLNSLPKQVKLAYLSGQIGDEELEKFFSQGQVVSHENTPASPLAIGPMTAEEQSKGAAFVQGYEENKTDGVLGGIGANLKGTAYKQVGGLAESLRDMPEIVKSRVGKEPSLLDTLMPGNRLNDVLLANSIAPIFAEAFFPEEDDAERRAKNMGIDLAVQEAKQNTNKAGQLAIDLAPQAAQYGTALASLLATKSPALAGGIAGLSLPIAGLQAFGGAYDEAGDTNLSPEEKLNRAKTLASTELLTELMVPGGKGSAYALKNFAKTVGSSSAQETFAEALNMVVDSTWYQELAPKNQEEVVSRLRQAAELGAVGGAVVGVPGSISQAKSVVQSRAAESAEYTNRMEFPELQGNKDAKSIMESIRAEQTARPLFEAEQLDLDLKTPEGPIQTADEYNAKLESDAKEIVAKRQAKAKALEEQDARRLQDIRSEVLANQGIQTGKGTMAERLRDAGAIGKVYTAPPKSPTEQVEQPLYKEQGSLFTTEPAQPKPTGPMADAINRTKNREEQQAKKDKASDARLRTKIEDTLLKESPNLSPNEFEAIVGLRMKAAKRQQAEQAAAPPEAATPKTKGKKQKQPKQEVTPLPTAEDINSKLSALKSEADLSSTDGAGVKTGLTKEAITRKFVYDESSEGNAFRQALRSGKVKLINSKDAQYSEVVDNAKGVHMRSDGTILLVTDKVTEDDVASVLLHETKHHLDRLHGDTGPRSVRNLVGEKANERLIVSIERAADYGNKVAKVAVDKYRAARDRGLAASEDEVVTYFMQEAYQARKKGGALGTARNITSDIISSIRTTAKKSLGFDMNVNVNDIGFLSRKLMGKLDDTKYVDKYKGRSINVPPAIKASYDAKTETGRPPQADLSVVGPRFLGYTDLESDVFFGKSDRRRRKELMTTNEAELAPNYKSLLKSDMDVPVTEFFDFPELFAGYPWFKDVRVRMSPKVNGADWRLSDKQITLGPDQLISRPEDLRNTILHEMQHAIQDYEGFARGDNPLNHKDEKRIAKITQELKLIETSVDQGAVLEAAKLLNIPIDRTLGTGAYRAQHVLSQIPKKLESASPTNAVKLTKIQGIRRYVQLYSELKRIDDDAFDMYLKSAGEAESRTVEARSRMEPEDRKAEGFYETMNKSRYASQNGKVSTANIVNGRDVGRPSFKAPETNVDLSYDPDNLTYQSDRGFGRTQDVHPYVIAQVDGKPIAYDTKSWVGKIADTFTKNLQGGRVPTAFREIFERMVGEKNEAGLKAINRLNDLQEKIEKSSDAKAAKDLLFAMENSETREARKLAGAKFKRNFPEVYESYQASRRDIVEMSGEIMKLMTKEGYKLTPREEAVVKSIYDNLGNYLTATYKILGPAKVRKEHIEYLNKTVAGQKDKADAIKWAEEKVFGLQNIRDKSKDWLEAMYDSLVPGEFKKKKPSQDISRRKLIQIIEAAVPQITEAEVKKASKQLVDDLLRIGEPNAAVSKLAKMYTGANQNMTIITPKQEISAEVRKLWGEQKDPVMNVFATLVRQGEFLAKLRGQFRMAEELSGRYLFDKKTDVPDGTRAEQIVGDAFGPLAGKWTTSEVAAYLQNERKATEAMGDVIGNILRSDSIDSEAAFGAAAKKFGRFLGWAGSKHKKVTVIWNPYNWAMNGAGSPLQLVANGNFFAEGGQKGLSIALFQAPGVAWKTYSSAEMLEVLRGGVLDNSLVGEIQNAERKSIVEGLLSTKEGKKISGDLVERIGTYTTDWYAGTDVWAKVANYFYEKEFLTNYYKARGKEVTPERLEREAAERIRATNFTFNRAFGPAKFLERNGITNFLTYQTEVFRTLTNNLLMGGKDFWNGVQQGDTEAGKMLRNHGLKRVAGASAAGTASMTIFKTMASMITSMLTEEDDDSETEKAIKQGLPGYLENRVFTLIKKDGEKRQYAEVGRLDPYGPAGEVMQGFANTLLTGDLTKIADALTGLVVVNAALEEVTNFAMAKLSDKGATAHNPALKSRAEDLFEMSMDELVSSGFSEEDSKRIIRVVEAFVPKIILTSVAQVMTTEDTPEIEKLYKAIGGSIVEYDPAVNLPRSAKYEYGSSINALRKDWGDWITNKASFTDDEIREFYNDTVREEFKAWNAAIPKIKAAQSAGMSRRQLQNLLKEGGLNGEQTSSLISERFHPTVLSTEKLKSHEADELKTETDRAKIAKIRQKYRQLRTVIARANRNLGNMEFD